MTRFEKTYLVAQFFFPVIHRKVRKQLLRVARSYGYRPEVLDVGGRKSHYTIGVPGNITISDLPRASELQHQLHLGINDAMIQQLRMRRSNSASCKLIFSKMLY